MKDNPRYYELMRQLKLYVEADGSVLVDRIPISGVVMLNYKQDTKLITKVVTFDLNNSENTHD